MKKTILLTLFVCFTLIGAKAQVTLTITNNSCEDIDYIANYSTTGPCMFPNYTNPAGPGTARVYTGTSTTLNIPIGGAWNFATFSDPCIGGGLYAVGNSCAWLCPPPPGSPTCTLSFITSWTSTCSACTGGSTTITATWVNTGGGSATLDFN